MSALLLDSKLPIACVVHDQFISFQRFVDIVLTNLHHIPGSGILASTIWKLRIHVHVIMCKEVDRRQMLSICADNRCYVAPCCGGVTRHSPRMSLNSEYYFVRWHTNATFSTHNSSAPIPDIRSPPDAETELYWPRLGSKCGPEEALAGFAWYRAWYIRHLTVPNRRIWVTIDMLRNPWERAGISYVLPVIIWRSLNQVDKLWWPDAENMTYWVISPIGRDVAIICVLFVLFGVKRSGNHSPYFRSDGKSGYRASLT